MCRLPLAVQAARSERDAGRHARGAEVRVPLLRMRARSSLREAFRTRAERAYFAPPAFSSNRAWASAQVQWKSLLHCRKMGLSLR